MTTLSAVVITKNEEKNIEDCLKNLNFCDEVIIIDDFSNDKTVFIAQKLKTKIYKRKLNENFSTQRNFGIKKASGDWILFIDADERVSESLAKEITLAINLGEYDGYYIPRRDQWLGKKLRGGEWSRGQKLRLGKKNSGLWKRTVHEYWDIKKSSQLKNSLLHLPHPTISEFVAHINSFSLLHENENLRERKSINFFKVFFYPPAKFLKKFIFERGYRDKERGFVYSMMMSLHSFLVWSSLWYKKH